MLRMIFDGHITCGRSFGEAYPGVRAADQFETGKGLGWMSLISEFSMPGWRLTDVDSGIACPLEQGWLNPAGNRYWRLTDAGFAAA
jgi:hypothetical protein